ncbi:hypothetical protein C0992_008451 [Termitomyces sp. T32_za158]|nr:hypothetical protein C0992_008451 [Termitomyces sp. T32_za158]
MKDSWVKLDWWFSCAAAVLAKEFNASVVRPFSPWAFGYNEGDSSHGRASFQIVRSQGWFNVWMGLVSYLIARAKSIDPYGMDTHWQRVLCQNHFPFDTIDALYASSVCDFSPNTERAGVFLDLTSNNTNQPSVEWFSKYNIPVWYRWSDKEISIPSLIHLAPLSSQMQRAVLESSNPVKQVRTLTKQPESGKEALASAKRPEYEVFFAGREEHNARRLLHESAADRQTRLNRERRPPTVSAQVFEWIRDEDDDNIWCRVGVRKADREETLGRYSEAQRRYDSFSNEWDCCQEFGPGDEESDEEFYEINDHSTFDAPYDSIARPPTILTPLQSIQVLDPARLDAPRVHPIQCASFAEPTSDCRKIGALEQQILEILALRFGFISSHPHSRSPPLLKSEAECKKVVRLLGLSWPRCQPYIGAVPCASLAKSYLENIAAGQRPKNDECDFNIQSRFSLSMSERCQYLRIVQSVGGERTFYMFDFGNKSEMPWKLSLTTAVNALLVCRLDPRFRETDIAEYLLQHGIPFQTFFPLRLALRAPRQPLPPCVLPMRLSNWEFGVGDYHSYVRQREVLLTQPRARAALMRGGIIWRLSVSSVSFSSVLQGPTGLSSNPNTMITVCDPKMNELFIDDDLTETELNLISGTYNCETGKPSLRFAI